MATHIVATAGDRVGADGMYAFGDSLLFLFAFGAASVPAIGAWLFFLRPYASAWRALQAAALIVAGTGIAAVAVSFATAFE